jgi:hypothetical protein
VCSEVASGCELLRTFLLERGRARATYAPVHPRASSSLSGSSSDNRLTSYYLHSIFALRISEVTSPLAFIATWIKSMTTRSSSGAAEPWRIMTALVVVVKFSAEFLSYHVRQHYANIVV